MRLTVRVGSVKTCEKVAVADWLAVIVATQVVAVPRHLRPAEGPVLQADPPSEAKRWLGWQPTVTFRNLVRIMGGCRSRGGGLARAEAWETVPYRWSARVAQATMIAIQNYASTSST